MVRCCMLLIPIWRIALLRVLCDHLVQWWQRYFMRDHVLAVAVADDD
jgi:hypothetical protein